MMESVSPFAKPTRPLVRHSSTASASCAASENEEQADFSSESSGTNSQRQTDYEGATGGHQSRAPAASFLRMSSDGQAFGISEDEFLKTGKATEHQIQREHPRVIKTPEIMQRSRLRDLRYVKQLGEGYYGRVYLVRKHSRTRSQRRSRETQIDETYFALKVIARERCGDTILRTELKIFKEASQHPLHTKILSAYLSRSHLYILMEYHRAGPLSGSIVSGIGLQDTRLPRHFTSCAVVALEFLHLRGICHRDVKCANILIGDDFNLKICDYGLARYLLIGERTHTLAGTPGYFAPEQLIGEGYDHCVDLWGLGTCVYEMLFGALPFPRVAPRELDKGPSTISADTTWGMFCDISFPSSHEFDLACTPRARSFLRALMKHRRKERLGGDLNYSAIKNHEWFVGIDWDGLDQGKPMFQDRHEAPSLV